MKNSLHYSKSICKRTTQRCNNLTWLQSYFFPYNFIDTVKLPMINLILSLRAVDEENSLQFWNSNKLSILWEL